MADEPTLPRLSAPAVSWNEQTQSFSGRGASKRTRGNDSTPPLFSNSSDPAFFSSDDDPALEDYLQGRRKKQKAGSWFSQQSAAQGSDRDGESSESKPKRTLERKLDSGVWLGSDGADTESGESDVFEPPVHAPSAMSELKPRQQNGLQKRVPSLFVSAAERAARQKIEKAIEDGTEDVDLSGMGLESLSNATLEPLAEFSCVPLVTEDVEFEQKEPSLRLYLGNNSLTRLPGECMLLLKHLTVLSLRGNRLRQIPHSILYLDSLRTLNVSQNALNYLPASMLDLLKYGELEEVFLHPNPFFEWDLTGDEVDEDSGERFMDMMQAQNRPSWTEARSNGVETTIQARTDVQLFDSTGRTCSDYQIPPPSETSVMVQAKSVWQQMLDKRTEAPRATPLSKVPSLLEAAFRRCAAGSELPELPDLLPDDTPTYMRQVLQTALEQRDAGSLACSECDRRMVTPSASWLEFWTLWKGPMASTPERVPFLRQACSSMCASSYKKRPEGDFEGERAMLKKIGYRITISSP